MSTEEKGKEHEAKKKFCAKKQQKQLSDSLTEKLGSR